MSPPPDFQHGCVSGRIARTLSVFAADHQLGEVVENVGFVLARDRDTVRGPDVAFLAAARAEAEPSLTGYIEGAPDLAVKVVSPSDRAADINAKVNEYLQAGANRVWTAWPEMRTVTVHEPGGVAHTFREDATLTREQAPFAVEGFALSVRDTFA